MTATGIGAFDHTLQTTNIWLNDLREQLRWDDRQQAYHALRVVLQGLRDLLTPEESTDLGAQLPMLVRGFYYEGWKPHEPVAPHHKRERLLSEVEKEFRHETHTPETIVRAVFRVIGKHVTPGEIKDVKACLPEEVRELWP